MKNKKVLPFIILLCLFSLLGSTSFAEENDATISKNIPQVSSEIIINVNGQRVKFEQTDGQPLLRTAKSDIDNTEHARTYVPIRKVAEEMGAEVGWRNKDRTVHIFKNGISVMLTVNENEPDPNMIVSSFDLGEHSGYTSMSIKTECDPGYKDVAPFITEDNRTVLPIRAVCETLGADVEWHRDSNGNSVIDISTYDSSDELSKMKSQRAKQIVEVYEWNLQEIEEKEYAPVKVNIPLDENGNICVKGLLQADNGNKKVSIIKNGYTFIKLNSGDYSINKNDLSDLKDYTINEMSLTIKNDDLKGDKIYTTDLYQKNAALNVEGFDNKKNYENKELTLGLGEKYSINASSDNNIVYQSKEPSIASVDEKGVISTNKIGTTDIIISSGNQTRVINLTIGIHVKINETTIIPLPENGQITNVKPVVSNSDIFVGKVECSQNTDDISIKGLESGKAQVVINYRDKKGNLKAEYVYIIVD